MQRCEGKTLKNLRFFGAQKTERFLANQSRRVYCFFYRGFRRRVFFAGIIGTGGALRGSFLNSLKLRKSSYIFTAAIVTLAVDLVRLPVYLAQGFLSGGLFYTKKFRQKGDIEKF